MMHEMATPDKYEFCLVMLQVSTMNVLPILLVTLVAQATLAAGVSPRDPSACQRVIKFMLINACGATKREFSSLPVYKVMTEEEIEKRYHSMVQAKMIKGVVKSNENDVNVDNDNDNWVWHVKDDLGGADDNEIYHKPHYQRLKRSVIGIGLHGPMKTLLDAAEHERRGSFHFISQLPHQREDREDRSPPPGELKAKCCGGVILCTLDDFRGFCE